MKYIEALESYVPQPGEISLFLGGGISNCADWQAKVVEQLKDADLVLLNPRRANFPMDDPNAADAQIKWEFDHLNKASMILFWFAPETLCPITLFEYGKWLVRNKQLFVGCDPQYKRKQDVEVQTQLERPSVPVFDSIEALTAEVIATYKRMQ